ncbi:MFS transporter, partial [uncultured Phenylobacterium sp.]|uniref:MFS transporter n=1 Tax=uncultured Phenylobacterium sp. TaxID=349273 RepID=UPI0025EC8406
SDTGDLHLKRHATWGMQVNYFLLIFYSQVIGLDARLVGLAITTALIFDAITDPIIGYWSDNLRSRWGRRHPFMYAAAVPVAASYFLLWNPPIGWPEQSLFLYVLGLSIFIRTFINFYETPSSALAAELTDDYDQRSSLLSWRYYFGWTGGNTMSVLMFMFLFPAFTTATITNGQFNRDAYELYGIIASGLIFLGIMVSALGTHSRIVHLKPAPPKRILTPAAVFREILETISNRSFVSLFAAALLGAIATGLSAALAFYFTTYFWGFTPQQTGWVTMSVFVSAIIGSSLAPIVTRTIGKKRGAIIIGLIAFLGSPLPILLRVAGILPGNDDPMIFWFVLTTTMIDVGLIICFQILSSSMLADLVEQAELKTGRRSEGLFFSAITFVRMTVQGLGVITASFVLAAAEFPKGAVQGEVSNETLLRLGAYYAPTILALWLAMIAVMSTYRLTRAGHEDNLRRLAESKAAAGR